MPTPLAIYSAVQIVVNKIINSIDWKDQTKGWQETKFTDNTNCAIEVFPDISKKEIYG